MIQKYALVCFAFFAFVASGFGQVTIVSDGLNNSSSLFTLTNGAYYTGNSATGDRPATTPFFSEGTHSRGISNGTATLETSNINTSNYSDIELQFKLASFSINSTGNGADAGDIVTVSVSPDGGTNWFSTLRVLGNANAYWSFTSGTGIASTSYDGDPTPVNFQPATGGNRTTDGYSSIIISDLPSSNNLRIRITLLNNAINERWLVDDVILEGVLASTDEVDFCNIQFPTASPQTITDGDNFTVYARAYEPGVTEAAGQGVGLNAWIGYNTVNNNPNDASWTWVPATFNVQAGNDDEFQAEIGSALAPGTYYYASRFQLNGGPFVYGGTGGIWNNDSVQLIVEPDQVNFCNVDFPKTGTINQGDNFDVFAQAYEPGVTDAAGQGANIEAWIGYNTIGIDYEPWQATGWTWVTATYDSDFGNNDNYRAQIGSTLPVGTYYYASRFRLNGSSFSYGGIQNDNVGNFWNAGTFNNGVLTVNTPPLADVVITEIMYNPGGTDDEWIEICNVSGSTQSLSGYTVRLGGTTRFTFPTGTNILDGQCITVSLGSNGDGTYNNPCPFVPDFGIGASTNNTNILPNGTGPYTITVVAANGTDVADTVVYGSADGANGNNSTLHVTNILLDNSDAGTNWQEVLTGGSPGVNSLISPCSVPELQLVNSSNVDQTCGAFTINFGSQATGFNTDLTFDIDNDGSSGLTISSFNISGTNPGDFSIVSPATPFTIASGNTQTVTVRFTPSALGARSAILTINSNDSDESVCDVDLQGTGTSPTPEINVEGDLGTFPDIANGDTTPSGTDNTLFAAQFIGSSQEKTFRIQNLGTAILNVSNVTVGGTNPGDFSISIAPANTVAVSGLTIFEVSFSPLAAGVREADIIITNDDNDENPYTFRVRGTGNCVANPITITPNSGPIGTIVTVNGTGLSTATASFNGVPAIVNNISNTVMEVTVPVGALTGNLEITDDLGCPGFTPFTIIDNQIGGCEGGSPLSDLFISEVTDATTGGLSYVEIYNGTGNPVDLSDYGLAVHGNGASTPTYTLNLNGVVLNNNDVYIVAIGTVVSQTSTNSCSITGGNGQLADQTSTLAGVNKTNNEHDMIRLVKSGGSIIVDAFGVYENTTWMDATIVTGDRGFNFRRLNTASPLPNPVFNLADWNVIDWVGSGQASCSTNDYSDIGTYDFSVGTPPTVSALIAPTSDCDLTATLTVTGTEGFDGVGDSQELAYQWFYSAPGELGWTAVTNNAIYSGATTNTLDILNTLSLDGYQYYCQVREDDATCFRASNSIKLNINATIWSAGSWSDGLPDINTIAIIDDNYNTNAGGEQTSFSACNLLVRIGTLTIANNTFVEVENNVSVESNIIVNEHGSFKQNNNAGAVTVTPSGLIRVRKETAPMNNWYEYTYWSSPVAGETIGNALNDATPNRRFWFNAQNYLDSFAETGNNNAAVAGQDDIDDAAPWDWTLADASDPMVPGVGYASTHRSTLFNSIPCSGGPNCQFVYTFEGPFNNGIYTVPVYRNDAELNDTNWNFIGNPYPSAISADLFLSANTILDNTIDGAIYLWSQNTAPADNANGNEVLNFAQADYAIINNSGQTAGGDGVPPTRHIPSGQGFFVSLSNSASTSVVSGTVRTADVVFNNQMRVIGNNNQFFRSADDTQLYNKLWINLTSNNGVFNQVLVSYIDGATDTDDGMYYDATRNLSTSANSILYSIIPNSDKKFAIQGKNPNSLTLDEVIPLGFYTSIEEATIYKLSIAQFEGDFFANQTVYVKDNLLNLFHDLSAADYSFTSETGEFNERFEIVFQAQTLGVGEVDIQPNDVSIIELTNGHVKFSVGQSLTIQSVEIFDMLGRQLYNLPGSNATEIYNLSNLSQAAYVAKVTLSNGQSVTKRAVKRQ